MLSGMKKKTSYFFCHSTLLHYLCSHKVNLGKVCANEGSAPPDSFSY